MNIMQGTFRIEANMDILPFLSHPMSVYSNARIIRPHLEVRYYRGVDLLTTDQFRAEYPHHYREFQVSKDLENTKFWVLLSVDPNCPTLIYKKGRRNYVVLPVSIIKLTLDNTVVDLDEFNIDQIAGAIQVEFANVFSRDFRIEVKARVSNVVSTVDKEGRADFYLGILANIWQEHQVLKSMPPALLENPVVRKRCFALIHRVMDLVGVQKDALAWFDFLAYLDKPVANMETATQLENKQVELDAVTQEIMEMQRKKDMGLWTEEDEAYVNSLK
jgi:hypothetical protein